MRILIITQLFDPEPNYSRGLDFARALVAEGRQGGVPSMMIG